MINLIKNELIKLFHYRSVLFLLIVLILVGPSTYISVSSGMSGEETFGERLAEARSAAEHSSFGDNIYRYLYNNATYKSLSDTREFNTNSKKALMELEGYDILYYYYYFDGIDNKEEADYYLNKYNELKNDINNLSTDEVLYKYKSFHESELEKLKEHYNSVTLTSEKEFFYESIENKTSLIDSYKYKKMYSKDIETDDFDFYASKILNVVFYSDYADITRKELDESVESFEEKEGVYNTIQTYYQDKYYLDNHMTNVYESSSFVFSQIVGSLLPICILVTLLFAIADLIPSEFKARTAKQLLIRPYSRAKILASKYAVAFTYGVAIVLVAMILFVFASSIVSGFKSYDNLVFYNLTTGKLCVISFFNYFLLQFISKVGFIALLITLLMFLEVITKNAGISGLVVLLLLIFGYAFGGDFYLNTFNPLMVSDFSNVLFGGIGTTLYSSMTTSIIVTLIELVFFGVGSFIIFNNIDVKND